MSDEANGEAERRGGNGSPPTVLMVAYRNMDPETKRLLQKIGVGMIAFGMVMPMAIEPFIPLSWVYWGFSITVVSLGACFVYLPIGIWFGNLIGGLAVKLAPSLGSKFHVDRRGSREEQGD